MGTLTILLLATAILVPSVHPLTQAEKYDLALELNEKAQIDATAVINNEVTIARALANAITELGIYVGTEMVDDLYSNGMKGIKMANEQLKRSNILVGIGLDTTINAYTLNTVKMFKTCVDTDPLLNNLTRFFLNQGTRLIKVNTDALNFRLGVAGCNSRAVELAGQTDECIKQAKLKTPYPVVPQYTIDTQRGINAIYACLDSAARDLNISGNMAIDQLKKFLPASLQNLVPSKFDSRPPNAAITADLTSYIPNAKINAVRVSLNRSKNIVRLANRDKLMSFIQARTYLKNLTNPYFEIVNSLSLPLSAQYCKVIAEVAGTTNLNLRSSNMITCIVLTEPPPTVFAHTLLENSFNDRELKERLFIPSVDCAKDLHNAFDRQRLQVCVKLAETSYWSALNTSALVSESYYSNALNVRRLVKRCQCNAELELQKQMKTDLFELESCLMKATKKRPNLPKDKFCASSAKCRYANVSLEEDEGEIIPESNTTVTNSTTVAPITQATNMTVDNRNPFEIPTIPIPSITTTKPTTTTTERPTETTTPLTTTQTTPSTTTQTTPSTTTPTTPATTPTTTSTARPTVRVTPAPDSDACTVFNNSSLGADGCGAREIFPPVVFKFPQSWDSVISF